MPRLGFALLFLALCPLAAAQTDTDDPPPRTGEAEPEDLRRVLPVYDPGSHTRAIIALGFSRDKSKLITVGQDYTIQIWSATTGERLDILRLPGYGREKGYDTARWDYAAVSPDGTLVAIGGAAKLLSEGSNERTRLLVVSLVTRQLRRIPLNQARGSVTALTFSPDGNRLAVGFTGADKHVAVVNNLNRLTARAAEKPPLPAVVFTPELTKHASVLAFTPDSKRLAIGEIIGKRITLWDVPPAAKATPTLVKTITATGETTSLAWSPDGSKFVRGCTYVKARTALRGIEVWGADGSQLKKWAFGDFAPVFRTGSNMFHTIRFLGPDTVFLCGTGPRAVKGFGTLAATIDLTSGRASSLMSQETLGTYYAVGAVTADAELAATTVTMGTDAIIYRLADGKEVARCGNRTPIPTVVGWSADPRAPGFAWSDRLLGGRTNTRPESLRYGFDLVQMEPLAALESKAYAVFRQKIGDWSFEYPRDELPPNLFRVLRGTTATGKYVAGRHVTAITLVPNGDKEPLVAWAARFMLTGGQAYLSRTDGTTVTALLPPATLYRDMAASPDGRYLVVATGEHRVMIYRTDGSKYPLLSFVSANGGWAAWTPEGYYAANPGGEKMIGWAVHNGSEQLVTFHPAEKFAATFRRPDVLKLAIEKGSVAAALAALKTKTGNVETLLPPKAELQLVKQNGATVQVKATAESTVKGKPVLAMRVLLDGRPLPEGRGSLTVAAGKPAEAVWDLDLPAGSHELRLLARSDDGSAVSDPLTVQAPKAAGAQPTLYRVCVGINDYDDAGLKLSAAARDANDVFAALEKHCVGPYNRFGAARGQLLVNKDATRAAVLKALAAVRRSARPGDLVVLFFAGHGIKQNDAFYLLTKEANPAKDLKGLSLSGEDLHKALSDMECPVLLILDACHSASAVRSFRPATDDLTRRLTDDSAGVTVLSAAMAHEVANASMENGYFTAALLKALAAGEGVPFDPHERALYTHHIYSVVFSEVRKATGGKQNPFLNMPWTVPPLPLREVPKP